MLFDCQSLLLVQISAVTNAAVAKLTAAGAVLVPFDSTPFDEANAAAKESVSYESGDAFSRYQQLGACLISSDVWLRQRGQRSAFWFARMVV